MSFFSGGIRRRRRKSSLALVGLSVVVVALVLGFVASAQSFTEQIVVPKMSIARSGHTATLLPDGRVLVVGGNYFVTTSEIYDPVLNKWKAAGNLSTVRIGHTATLLANGQVLVVGGGNSSSSTPTELYDPATGRWRLGGEPRIRRNGHTATLLKNGNVLVAGGDTVYSITTAELYTAATSQWSDAGNLSTLRVLHTATLLPDGRVLVTGGSRAPTTAAEIYNAASGEWRATGPMKEQRQAHTATLLRDGRVLVVGGFPNAIGPYPAPGSPVLFPSTEVYSSTTNTWAIGPSMFTPRWAHTATLLPDGRVIVIGGYSTGGYSSYAQVQSSVEIFDPANNRWYVARPLSRPRAYHTTTLLADGTLLVVGGNSVSGQTDTAERYDPSNALLGVQYYLSLVMRNAQPPFFQPTAPPFSPTPTPLS